MKKRVLSLMLATVMCMALAVTANAVEYDSSMVNLGERAGSVLSVEQTLTEISLRMFVAKLMELL